MPDDERTADVSLPRTERRDAPLYLARYLERRARESGAEPPGDPPGDPAEPLYLRRFRERRAPTPPSAALPGEAAPNGQAAAGGFERQAQWADTVKSKEIIPEAPPDDLVGVMDVHFVRHGETQGYSVDGGLTPMGGWQSRRRGLDLSKGVRDGSAVKLVCAPTARAAQTAEQVRRGIEDGLANWQRSARIEGPEPWGLFDNFQFWSPAGPKDVTQAFREYHAVNERYERVAQGERPLWLVEMDRFWHSQSGGGDPIAVWMYVPMLHFESPASVVRLFWLGLSELAAQVDGNTTVVVCTHSGPMRVMATWALGHDAGEPYNTEEVRVRVHRDRRQAVVTFRNRSQEVRIPEAGEWPAWTSEAAETGAGR
jgi:broad specificity phosphatase PhoE